MRRAFLFVVLVALNACASLDRSAGPAPVESREVPRNTGTTAPAERPMVGPPLPSELEPRGSAPPPPATASPAATLLAQVDTAIAADELDRAGALVERALRIAPRDAQVWYKLANIRYLQGRFGEAEGSAQRALSFAGGNEALARTINALLADVRSAR